ncbi:MAG: HAD-IA family hydrolase [Anaerolineae bacterium]|nr:HAD-IA family hydrolase [Anaerolineae bacterium]
MAISKGLFFRKDDIHHGVRKAMKLYKIRTTENSSLWADDQTISNFFIEIFGEIFSHCLISNGHEISDGFAEHLGSLVLENYHSKNYWEIFDGVIPTLNYLNNKGYVLGIYSDWWSELPDLLHQLELKKFFQFIYTSAGLGVAKKQNGAFKELAKVTQISPLKTAFIGDSLELDIMPAHSIGMKTVWINHNNKSVPHDVISITSFDKITQLFT